MTAQQFFYPLKRSLRVSGVRVKIFGNFGTAIGHGNRNPANATSFRTAALRTAASITIAITLKKLQQNYMMR